MTLLATFKAHKRAITAVQWCSGSTLTLVAASRAGSVKMWQVTGLPQGSGQVDIANIKVTAAGELLNMGKCSITSLAACGQGSHCILAAGTASGAAAVVGIDSGEVLCEAPPGALCNTAISALSFQPRGSPTPLLAVGTGSGAILFCQVCHPAVGEGT